MPLKKKNKTSAEFSMSSLTDIIFLLLIFFMLTSGLVAPNSLNLKLPGSTRSRAPINRNIDNVQIREDGTYEINGRPVSPQELEDRLSRKANKDESITIAPESGTPVEHVVLVMDMAMRYNINGILAAERD
ncbi:MAG: biopolymer transporter ExbD [Saprospiraceae bacterium]|nr:biopolymer transporter ExbD [Saprospiraceae bacterium]